MILDNEGLSFRGPASTSQGLEIQYNRTHGPDVEDRGSWPHLQLSVLLSLEWSWKGKGSHCQKGSNRKIPHDAKGKFCISSLESRETLNLTLEWDA